MTAKRETGSSEKAADKILKIGIDLGTSCSAVSASNGKNQLVLSYVGWPKDFVSRKSLGKRVLFGEEALEHRLSLDLIRPLASGVIKENTERAEEAVSELIGHLVDLCKGSTDATVHVAVGVPAEAMKVNQQAIKNAVSRFADKVIVISEPFSVAYGLDMLDNAMVIDIGAGTVDFCIMHGTLPGAEDQRSLFTAGDYVDQQLLEMLKESYPQSHFTLNLARKFKEQYGFVGKSNEKIVVEVPIAGKFVKHDITDEIRRACECIMPPIVETIMEMIGRFDPEYQEKVRENIVIAGGGSRIANIDSYLKQALKDFADCSFKLIEDPYYGGANGALALANEMPEEYWSEIKK
ncbi:MAG: MamK family actin-like protein [Gammaproteobacteria bacterium]